jgi:hypothetical protein
MRGLRYLIAEMIAAVAVSTTETSVTALISMVMVIFTMGTSRRSISHAR